MFGSSNLFGQSSSSSPFGTQTQPVFGQTNNASSNPFAPKPFGTSTPFGAQTGSSMFGGTSTGVFGQPQASSPFGASSQAFGSSTRGFGASSAPAFGSSTSPFGGASTFGQNSSGFSTPQPSPFGSTTQQSQPAFGNSTFGSSTPFGSSNTPAFGSTSTPGFGATNTPGFGASNAPAFGSTSTPGVGATSTPGFGATSTPGFGSTSTPGFGASSTPAFGATNTPGLGASNTPAFGSTSTPGFGASNTPVLGSTNTPAFGASSTPSFGATSSPAFGASPTSGFGNSGTAFGNNAFGSGGAFGGSGSPAFGASSTPAFGASSTPAFGVSSTPAFGASSTSAFGASNTPSFSFGSSSAFGSGSLGSTQSPFGAQGTQASTPTFGGQSAFGGQQGGSRVMPYAPTKNEAESGTSSQPAGNLLSISGMPVHKDKNHEELRWEDYQRGDKGGALPAGQSPGGAGFGVTNSQPSLFTQSPAFGQTSANPVNAFSSSTTTNPFGQKTPTTTSNFPSPFGQNTTPSMFGSSSSTSPSVFGSSTGFATTTWQPFGTSSTPGFSSSPSIFGSAPAQGPTPTFNINANFNNSQSSPLFSSNPSFGQTGSAFGQTGSAFGQTSSAFGQTSSAFGQTSSAFGQTNSAFGQNPNPGFFQTNNFSTPSTGFGNLFSSSSSLTTSMSPFNQTTPVGLTPYQSAQPAQQPSGGFGFNTIGKTQIANTTSFTGGMGSFNQGNFGSLPANSTAMQPIPVTNPFGTLPALPQMSIAQGGNSPSVQYGISSMPVVDKAAPVRVSSILTSRHILQRRVRLPTRKYHPGDNGPLVPFFINEEESSNTPKADARFIPRENPRALFIRPIEREKSAPREDDPMNGKGSNGVVTNGANHENKDNSEIRDASPVKAIQKPNGTHENHISPSVADIESLMPKLHHAEYFTEPRIQELAAKERVNPGYCKRVRDFVVGRHGYGNIKFIGETDVRKLDLELLVQFNNREVIVYMDESKKPPVGEGLNKPAEVTLLNIKCIDKKSGKQVKEGPRLDKYKEMLKRKAEEQGAQFLSYDGVNGEWKFKVEHFSSYKLENEDDE